MSNLKQYGSKEDLAADKAMLFQMGGGGASLRLSGVRYPYPDDDEDEGEVKPTFSTPASSATTAVPTESKQSEKSQTKK
ncbi:hypothetical protein HDU98_008901 [Podochytrium sp. JEL0797]|nr:hypothetical protein HDU98_008901 [Podochytrium sp. JEL0797]